MNYLEDEKKELEERLKREEEIHNLQMNSISEFGNALEGLGAHGKTFVSYFNAALQSALRIADAINSLETDQLSGILGIATGGFGFLAKFIPGLAKGGTVTNFGGGNVSFQPHQKFATGVSNFTVPPGFNRDDYLIGVQSGEKVTVTPASGNNNQNTDRILTDVYNRIGALTEVMRSQVRSSGSNTIVLKIGDKTIGTIVQEANNRFNRQNTIQTTDF
ncbi:MAG: hypothetical protein IPK06_04355 [Ignavibacteriae bacterium]|nr:hypothetical protein [Ignavibacteriota bacterium]